MILRKYFKTFQSTLESFFSCWYDIEKHREVVLFACGLMSDPTPLVDHVYQMWIDEYLEKIRNSKYDDDDDDYDDDYDGSPYTDLLESLYIESKAQLPGCALHNNNINIYDHKRDDGDTTHVYTPSKMYKFLNMKESVLCKFDKREQTGKITQCILVIKAPDAVVTNSLLMTCKQISNNQEVADLHMYNFNCKYQQETDLLNLSKNAHSLLIRSCSLPSQPLNHLMQKLSECNNIRKIDLSDTNLQDISALTLRNKKSLTHLDLSETNISAELCRSICEQLTDITHLEYLDMSYNDLSQVSKFVLNNKKNLKYLNLQNTNMSSTPYHSICQQLIDLESLEQFVVSTKDSCFKIFSLRCDLSGTNLPPHVLRRVFYQINRYPNLTSTEITDTPITGCLPSFLPNNHPGLPELRYLYLINTELNKDDLQHLCSIAQSKKLPKLQELDLSKNILTRCLSSFLPDPHPGLPELNKLHLRETSLNKDDLCHLLSIAYKLPKLEKLDLSGYTLTGCLSSFLPDPHPGLRNLTYLDLRKTSLNKDDLCHLLSIAYKLPELKKLDLSGYTLTGCLSSFLPDPHPGLPNLTRLHLRETSLNKDDLCHLLFIAYKLPKLEKLDLSGYTLTGCLSSFLPDPHPGLPELWYLNLSNTELNKEDLEHLSHITQTNKLPKLESLNLSQNTLTAILSGFLSDPHPGLPRLYFLSLSRTALNKEDLHHLKHLAPYGKLPQLLYLHLGGNELFQMKEELRDLVETLIWHQRKLRRSSLYVWLADNDLPEEFQKQLIQKCKGTKICVNF